MAAQKCKVSVSAVMANHARGAWATVQGKTLAEACHVRGHTGERGNECADVLAELGRRSLRWSFLPVGSAPARRALKADQEA